MTEARLHVLASEGESATLEFKKSTGQRTDAAKSICAMLNSEGGVLVFGVRSDGKLVGQQVSDSTMEQVVQELRRIAPYVPVQPERVDLASGKQCLVLRVPAGLEKPYTYAGRAFFRQGPTTLEMPQNVYERLLIERAHPMQRWELQPAYQRDVSDLDAAEITRTVEESIRRGRMAEPGTRDPREVLEGLGLLLEDGRITNAAFALFGREERMRPYYPQCHLKLAKFRGTTMSEFVDNRQVVGNAFRLFVAAQVFLQDYLPIAGRIIPGVYEREDVPLYPPEALREALANALCHRDYAVAGGYVSVAIFDDRLEITSVGRLPFGLTVDDLITSRKSRPWNPNIANVFYRRGVIESWGRGTQKILELSEQAGLERPEFIEASETVTVRFLPDAYVPPTRFERDLTELQRNILQVVADLEPVALRDLLAALDDTPERTVQDNLQFLRRVNLVSLVGHGRGARWRIA
ncbi:MAG: ATP-binding protein [Bacteroidota bacterium]